MIGAFTACSPDPVATERRWIDDNVRLNHLQMLGSHNSYKQAISPSLMRLIREEDPETADSLDYAHIPLDQQLDLGMRVLELDVLHDPEGGRYAHPGGIQKVQAQGLPPGPSYDPEGIMARPGLKVLHVQDIDFRSHCLTFADALRQLREWSDAHPGHLPIIITMNTTDAPVDRTDFVQPLPFDRDAYDALDQEIRQGLPPEKLLTPDLVRGNASTLEAAVRERGWPKLGQVRGRVMFVLDEGAEKCSVYADGHPSLRGRVLFMDVPEGSPEAAFRIVNDPIEKHKYIQGLVRQGYLVRTRADSDTAEARTGDMRRLEHALTSGAHCISTDYYHANPAFGTGYRVRLPDEQMARWNPLLGPTERSWDLVTMRNR